MNSLLIVDQHQFGYLTDTYKYCQHLRDAWSITVVCWDYGSRRVSLEGINVLYVSRDGSKPQRLGRFIRQATQEIRSGRYDIVFCVYFLGCSLLRNARKGQCVIMDIRTGSDRGGTLRRRFDDEMLRLESRGFDRITVVSKSLMHRLRLDPAKCHLLPLGGDAVEIASKTFDSLRLFYVGTLFRREIHKTVEGLDRVYRAMDGALDVSYDIVGDGTDGEKEQLIHAIERSSLRDFVHYHGPVPNAELRPFLERNNVGVAYIPIEEYYDCQPSTKVFEYLLAGMPVLATATSENRAVITRENGVLFQDSVEGFAEGVRAVLQDMSTYESTRLMASVREYRWTDIVNSNLRRYLESAMATHTESYDR
jgi:glycosyltransferase involved in cell wall biosynthesis